MSWSTLGHVGRGGGEGRSGGLVDGVRESRKKQLLAEHNTFLVRILKFPPLSQVVSLSRATKRGTCVAACKQNVEEG